MSLEAWICDTATSLKENNIVHRHKLQTSEALYNFDKVENTVPGTLRIPGTISCYGCSKPISDVHRNYVFSCAKCGALFQRCRYMWRSLVGQVAVVTGARTKLGHQIALKLLRAGAVVYGTTRYPDRALDIYSKYSDYRIWQERLHLYALDFDTDHILSDICSFVSYMKEHSGDKAHILVNCAAQTIRCREKGQYLADGAEENRYGDSKHVPTAQTNSWNMQIGDITQEEMEEVFRVNVTAPTIMVQQLLPLFQPNSYIINVHAKEGLLDVHKTSNHMHTNMAKSGLHMLTRCLQGIKTCSGHSISVHGCDPGWISIDEYELKGSPWILPPLDEIDGAARILYPLWTSAPSEWRTRRHFLLFKI